MGLKRFWWSFHPPFYALAPIPSCPESRPGQFRQPRQSPPLRPSQASYNCGRQTFVRYSCNTMNERLPVDPIDPVRLTRELCEIESTTYHEGAVGDFLADFLAQRHLFEKRIHAFLHLLFGKGLLCA